ncbi:MAG: hypothetical protein IPK64_18520 [bacterium]|nr:hypothetical protein [bacterium]
MNFDGGGGIRSSRTAFLDDAKEVFLDESGYRTSVSDALPTTLVIHSPLPGDIFRTGDLCSILFFVPAPGRYRLGISSQGSSGVLDQVYLDGQIEAGSHELMALLEGEGVSEAFIRLEDANNLSQYAASGPITILGDDINLFENWEQGFNAGFWASFGANPAQIVEAVGGNPGSALTIAGSGTGSIGVITRGAIDFVPGKTMSLRFMTNVEGVDRSEAAQELRIGFADSLVAAGDAVSGDSLRVTVDYSTGRPGSASIRVWHGRLGDILNLPYSAEQDGVWHTMALSVRDDGVLVLVLDDAIYAAGESPGGLTQSMRCYVAAESETTCSVDDLLIYDGYPLQTVTAATRGGTNYGLPAGDLIPVDISWNYSGNFTSGRLLYRLGGAADFQAAPVVADTSGLWAAIPGAAVGARGLEYYVEIDTPFGPVVMTNGGAPASYYVYVEVDNFSEPEVVPARTYRMVSVPLALRDETWSETNGSLRGLLTGLDDFGEYGRRTWRAFRWSGVLEDYVELPEAEAMGTFNFSLAPGRSFWLISAQPSRLTTERLPVTSLEPQRRVVVLDQPGWNQIANPFAFPVAWSGITVDGIPIGEPGAADLIDTEFMFWNPNQSSYAPNGAVLPLMTGFFVYRRSGSEVRLEFPAEEALYSKSVSTTLPVADSGHTIVGPNTIWHLDISATSGPARDDLNTVGVAPGAADTWDTSDHRDVPPPPGESISLYFPHADWGQRAGRYRADIRGSYAKVPDVAGVGADLVGQVWRFDVAKNFALDGVADEVRLEFRGMEALPADAVALLYDRELLRAVNLHEADHYTYRCATRNPVDEADARFLLVVGSQDFVVGELEKLDLQPARTELGASFPNPFNPVTAIRYDLREATHVRLRVYDVRGALVKVLVDAVRPVGRHEVLWTGDDGSGRRVSSGVYFCRMETNHGFRATSKLLLAK